jgi:hypothetical protein
MNLVFESPHENFPHEPFRKKKLQNELFCIKFFFEKTLQNAIGKFENLENAIE